jgi:hypothetical protein
MVSIPVANRFLVCRQIIYLLFCPHFYSLFYPLPAYS